MIFLYWNENKTFWKSALHLMFVLEDRCHYASAKNPYPHTHTATPNCLLPLLFLSSCSCSEKLLCIRCEILTTRSTTEQWTHEWVSISLFHTSMCMWVTRYIIDRLQAREVEEARRPIWREPASRISSFKWRFRNLPVTSLMLCPIFILCVHFSEA